MKKAFSFSLTFATDELARKFVRKVTLAHGVPCLRYGKVVYTMAVDAKEKREVLSIGRQLGGEGGA